MFKTVTEIINSKLGLYTIAVSMKSPLKLQQTANINTNHLFSDKQCYCLTKSNKKNLTDKFTQKIMKRSHRNGLNCKYILVTLDHRNHAL